MNPGAYHGEARTSRVPGAQHARRIGTTLVPVRLLLHMSIHSESSVYVKEWTVRGHTAVNREKHANAVVTRRRSYRRRGR